MLHSSDIKPGRTYRAKRPRDTFAPPLDLVINDRHVLYVSPSGNQVQYDAPTVKMGQRQPLVSMEKFLAWAAYDCTEEMPEDQGKWAPAPLTKEQRAKCKAALGARDEQHL